MLLCKVMQLRETRILYIQISQSADLTQILAASCKMLSLPPGGKLVAYEGFRFIVGCGFFMDGTAFCRLAR